MTDEEIMYHRFRGANIHKRVAVLAEELGITVKEYVEACERAMYPTEIVQEVKEDVKG